MRRADDNRGGGGELTKFVLQFCVLMNLAHNQNTYCAHYIIMHILSVEANSFHRD